MYAPQISMLLFKLLKTADSMVQAYTDSSTLVSIETGNASGLAVVSAVAILGAADVCNAVCKRTSIVCERTKIGAAKASRVARGAGRAGVRSVRAGGRIAKRATRRVAKVCLYLASLLPRARSRPKVDGFAPQTRRRCSSLSLPA